jgi:hypothetical protein
MAETTFLFFDLKIMADFLAFRETFTRRQNT